MDEALRGRREIQEAPDDTMRAIQKARFHKLDDRVQPARIIGDATLAAFFTEAKPRGRGRRRQEVESLVSGSLNNAAWTKLKTMAATLREGEHCATGVFSSRKLERVTYDSVAFRFIAANDHPDYDTIAVFRRRFLAEIEALFVQVLLLAREMGVLKMGTVALDGTKIHANASRHSALSHEHAGKIEAQLKAEVADLMAKAEAADAADIPDGMSIPDELARREERLRKLAEARAKIAARAKERHAREQAEHEAKLAARQAKAEASGKKPGGKPPEPPVAGPRPKDQINLTDEDSRIMPVAGGGFDQCYNAQAAVAAGSLLVVASVVSQAPNDKQQLEPMLDKIEALAERAGRARAPAGGHGLFQRGECRGLREGEDPTTDRHGPSAASSAVGRALRSGAGSARRSDAGRGHGASAEDAGRPDALRGSRKQIPEPVFGIIKSALGFRQFSLRGLNGARGEWSLVTMAWNIKRLGGPPSADRPQETPISGPFDPSCIQSHAQRAQPAKTIHGHQPQPPVRQAARRPDEIVLGGGVELQRVIYALAARQLLPEALSD